MDHTGLSLGAVSSFNRQCFLSVTQNLGIWESIWQNRTSFIFTSPPLDHQPVQALGRFGTGPRTWAQDRADTAGPAARALEEEVQPRYPSLLRGLFKRLRSNLSYKALLNSKETKQNINKCLMLTVVFLWLECGLEFSSCYTVMHV